jgi:hypothetical protein
MYPYRKDTVPGTEMNICGTIGGILIVSLARNSDSRKKPVHKNFFKVIMVETNYHSADASSNSSLKNLKLFNWTLTPFIQNMYHYITLFLFAESIERCVSEGIKLTIGRLRPHFMKVSSRFALHVHLVKNLHVC